MYQYIKPAPDSVVGRVFPGLEAKAMIEVVRWFPVIEDFVAILNGSVCRC